MGDGAPQLISSGTSQFDSGLLSVTADGVDAYFFTHDTLAADEDENGPDRIYDARADGGFFAFRSPPPCAASDECHGPGTRPGPPPDQPAPGRTSERQPHRACPKGKVKQHGKCVKKKSRRSTRRGRRRAGSDG